MEIGYELPLDADGFLRRKCPHCEQEFKWHHGPTEDAPSDFVYGDVYWCPRCGRAAALDQWFTQAQIDHQLAVVKAALPDVLGEALRSTSGSSSRSGITFSAKPSADRPSEPDPLVEPDDMDVIASPCHPWEPVKVPADAATPVYCLLCGEAYAV